MFIYLIPTTILGKMHPLVKKLEEKLRSEFTEVVERINNFYPGVVATFYSIEAPNFDGHDFYIDCTIENALSVQPDNLCLAVSLGSLSSTPKIDSGVSWGHPSGHQEIFFGDWSGKFPNDAPEASDEMIQKLFDELPKLYQALYDAIKRGKPHEDD